jgi:WD40 repeat protein/serine/threonine protein kinase/endogenous inhibitor of DNA gyrase (YacG/DUF329 family)
MLCPRCQLELPLDAASQGSCPSCSYQLTTIDMSRWLTELEESSTTAGDFELDTTDTDINKTISAIQQTIQFDNPEDLSGSDPKQTISANSQTVELSNTAAELAKTWNPANQATWDGSTSRADNNATLDSGTFPPIKPGSATVVDNTGTLSGDFEISEASDDPKKTVPITATLVQPADPGSTIDSATLDSHTLKALGKVTVNDRIPDEDGTFDERRIAATMDSAQLSQSDGEILANMWGGTYAPTTTPRMTIKRDGRGSSPKDSRLVIKPKALVNNPTPALPLKTGADYELLNVIGEGGVGVVYAARQASIDRTVALKMLKAAGAKSPEQREKFLSEAVVTADLDHPNIVPIYELGANEAGALFYSMKKVQGTPWSKVIGQKSTIENLEILMKVADAVAFAHARGIIHRDLKPENIMLGEFGEVLVMDWGLAMATPDFRKSSTITQTHSMGGTPAYMAPEMAGGSIETVTMLSDVYLLGAMLYEVLTGQPPHTGKTVMKCLVAAARNEIQETNVTGELMDIALRAMATRRQDRPQSVLEFQQIIREYEAHSESLALEQRAEDKLLAARETESYEDYARAVFEFDEAVELWSGNLRAKSRSMAARLEYAQLARQRDDLELADSLLLAEEPTHSEIKSLLVHEIAEEKARRHRLKMARRIMIGMAAAIILLVTGALIWVNHEKGIAVDARERAETSEQKAVQARDQEAIAKDDALKQKQVAEKARDQELIARQAAETAEQSARKAEADAVAAKVTAEQAKAAEEYAAYIARIGLAAAKVEENAFGEVLDLLNECPPSFRNWEWGRLRYLCGRAEFTYHTKSPLDAIASSPDGKRYAVAGQSAQVTIFHQDPAEQPLLIDFGGASIQALAWSPDGNLLAVGGLDETAGHLKLFDAKTGTLLHTWKEHTDGVTSLRFSKNSQQLLSASYDQTARLWDVPNRKLLRTLQGHSWWVWSAEWSPDERYVVTAGQDGQCVIWDLNDPQNGENLQRLQRFTGHTGPVYAATFLPDGERIASAGYNQQILLWQRSAARPFPFDKLAEKSNIPPAEYRTLTGHRGPIRSLHAFADGSSRLLSTADDNTIRIWDVTQEQTIQTLRGHSGRVSGATLLEQGKKIVTVSHDQLVKGWNLAGYEEVRVLKGKLLAGHADAIQAADFSPDSRQLVTASRDRTAIIWDTKTGKLAQQLDEGHDFLATSLIIFPDGQRFATAAMDNTTRIWNLASGVEERCLTGTGRSAVLAISPDSERLITASSESAAIVWNTATGEQLLKLAEHRGEVTAAAWSGDSQLLATADAGGRIKLWSRDGRLLWSVDRHTASVTGLAFDRDHTHLYSSSNDQSVGCSRTANGQEVVSQILKHSAAVTHFAVNLQHDLAITATNDQQVTLWKLSTAQQQRQFTGIAGRITGLAITGDGKQVAICCTLEKQGSTNDVVQFFDCQTGQELKDRRLSEGSLWASAWVLDGEQLLTVGGNGARLWDITKQTVTMNFLSHRSVGSVQFSPTGEQVLTASADSTAKLWNAATGQALKKLPLAHTGAIQSARYSPDGQWIVTASADNRAILWDAKNLTAVKTFDAQGSLRAMAWYPDSQQFATVGEERIVQIWDRASGKLVKALPPQPAAITSIAIDPLGKYLVTGAADQIARIYDASSGELLRQLVGHTADVTSVAITPDARRVVTGSVDTTVKLWDTTSAKELLTLSGHTQAVTCVVVSRDGQQVLTTSRDGTAILWLAEPWQVENK